MQPELNLGPLTLQTFGISFALAFLAAGAVITKRLRELKLPVDWAYELCFSGLLGGLVGSRLDYMAENWSDVSDDLLGSLFSGAGLVWYGGAIGGAIGVCLWARRRGLLDRRLLDLCAPALAIGYAIGRIGCQLSGDGDYGIAWDGPWAMAYPNGTVPTDVKVHPTPIYEALAMTLAAYALWRLRDRFRVGVLFSIYLVAAGSERFVVEFVRRNDDLLLGLTQAQLLSVAMFLTGAALLARTARGPGLRVSAVDPGSG